MFDWGGTQLANCVAWLGACRSCRTCLLCWKCRSSFLVGPSGDESGEEEEDGERLDQQMGEAGPEGEDVDERLWNDEDREQEQQGQVR